MSRPAQFGVPADQAIRVRVTPEQRQQLEQVSREVGLPVAGVIREAVNSFVADYRDGDVPFRGPKP